MRSRRRAACGGCGRLYHQPRRETYRRCEGVRAPRGRRGACGIGRGSRRRGCRKRGTGAAALVNINSAGLDELDTLPGVGPSTAQAILDDRTQNGPFASVEDIMRVSGIGEKKFEKLKDLICV